MKTISEIRDKINGVNLLAWQISEVSDTTIPISEAYKAIVATLKWVLGETKAGYYCTIHHKFYEAEQPTGCELCQQDKEAL